MLNLLCSFELDYWPITLTHKHTHSREKHENSFEIGSSLRFLEYFS